MSLIDYLRFRKQTVDRSTAPARQKIPIPNPLNTLRVLCHKEYDLPIKTPTVLWPVL